MLWDFDGTLAFRDGHWSSTLVKALEPAAPELAPDLLGIEHPQFGDERLNERSSRRLAGAVGAIEPDDHGPRLPVTCPSLSCPLEDERFQILSGYYCRYAIHGRTGLGVKCTDGDVTFTTDRVAAPCHNQGQLC